MKKSPPTLGTLDAPQGAASSSTGVQSGHSRGASASPSRAASRAQMQAKSVDFCATLFITACASLCALALAAILLFLVGQGIEPFLSGGQAPARLVVEGVPHLILNGESFEDAEGRFIDLPTDGSRIEIQIPPYAASESAAKPSALPVAERLQEERVILRAADAQRRPGSERNEGLEARPLVIDELPQGAVLLENDASVMSIRLPPLAGGTAIPRKLHILLPEQPLSLARFLGEKEWRSNDLAHSGILALLEASLLSAGLALLLALPLALPSALLLARFLPKNIAAFCRSAVELLAGIPSVVYGFFGLQVIVPAVKQLAHVPTGNSLLAASITLALMILPTLITLSEAALRSVPGALTEASLALGASPMQTAWGMSLPHVRSSVICAIVLALSRAAGETMAVILVAGNSVQLVESPLSSVRTLTATIALEMGYAEGRHRALLFSIGLVLCALALIQNAVILLISRPQEKTDGASAKKRKRLKTGDSRFPPNPSAKEVPALPILKEGSQ